VILLLEVVFWVCLGAIVWTHVGYPLFMALLARVRPRPVAAADILPTVTFLIPAYNEEGVIEQLAARQFHKLFDIFNDCDSAVESLRAAG